MTEITEEEAECNQLQSALNEKGKGDFLISFLLGKNRRDRQIIRDAYKKYYKKELEEEVNKKLSGNYRRTVIDLIRRPAERDAIYLYKAMKGAGTNEDTLIEIICTRNNLELSKIKEEFSLKYKGDTLGKWIQDETGGAFKKLLMAILECKRSENSMPDDRLCKELAEDLFDPDKKKIKTDQETVHKIFVNCSPPEIYTINKYYSEIHRRNLKEDIEKEFSSHMKIALLTILESIVAPSDYFARRINKAVKGLGTNDKMLIRVLASREGLDIAKMRESYQKIFNKDMIQDIKDDTTGEYQNIVVALASRE